MKKEQYYKLNKTIYTKENKNNIVYFNYENPNGLLVARKEIKQIISMLDGKTTLSEISSKLKIDPKLIIKYIEELKQKNVIQNNVKCKKKSNTLNCWFHITNKCNFNCDYCYVNKSSVNMNEEIAKKAIDKLIEHAKSKKYTGIGLSFSGGEPLLKFELIKRIVQDYKYAEPQISYRIITNGSLLDKNIIKFIVDNNIKVTISLDGIQKYNDIKRYYKNGLGTYDCVIKNIKTLIANNINPLINCVITETNINKLPKYTKEMIELGVPLSFTIERATNQKKPSVLYNEKKIIKKIIKCINICKKELKKGKKVTLKIDKISFSNDSNRLCKAGEQMIAIGSNGEISYCGMALNNPISNINNEKDIFDAFKKEQISNFKLDDLEECTRCMWKKVCRNGCPISNYNLYKSLNQKTPCCKIYKKIIPHIIDFYMTDKNIKKGK